MCFGGGSSSQSPSPASVGDQINKQEAARQAAVRAGNTNIDTAFARFNDPYFQGYQDTYKSVYDPQLDTQFNDATGTLEAGLARQGLDRSSVYATQLGKLYGQYADAKTKIGDDAATAANDLRTKVQSEKSNLYALNASSADPAQANTRALAAQTALVSPPTYSPLGAVFANFLQPYTAFANSYANGTGPGYTSPYATVK